jgi:hypothetical protein
MQIRKTLVVALAVIVAIAFSPLSELRAAPFAGNGSQSASSELLHAAQAKPKAKKKAGKKKRKGKKGRKAKAGKSCGTYMYRKGGKCLDARNKK